MGIRQKIDGRANAKCKKLSLFADDAIFSQYRYSVIVTDINLPAAELWRLYRGRADCENRIKELKYDFGGENNAPVCVGCSLEPHLLAVRNAS